MDELMDPFNGVIVAINVGIQDFGSALEEQGIQVVYVEWSPPAGGDQEMIDLLDQLL
jgi:FdrA protein